MVCTKLFCLLVILVTTNAQEFNNDFVFPGKTNAVSISYTEQKCNEYASKSKYCDFQIEYIPPIKPMPKEFYQSEETQYLYEPELSKAMPKEFPHVALIGFKESDSISWTCNGFLISERYVLTAAHCVSSHFSRGQPNLVRLGELDTKSTTDDAQPQDFSIEEITVHPDYLSSEFYNNIAIIRLDKDVTFTPYVRPACLQTLREIPSYNLINSAWGSVAIGGLFVEDMMKVTLQTYSNKECNDVYSENKNTRKLKKGIIDEEQICAGSANPNNDICQGSSGSPLQIYHPKFRCTYTVVGISSFGKGCGIANVPSVYTRISHYIPWIETIIRSI